MPTTRLRHQITETDDIEAAIDRAARQWPHESRSDLIRRLVLIGAQKLLEDPVERALQIELAFQALDGVADAYPPGYLEDLRRDWDERPA
mgnify:FL=1